MKKILYFSVLFFCLVSSATAQFDPKNPKIKGLSAAEVQTWAKKDLAEWKKAFGSDLEKWNPIQMEFYSAVRIAGLTPQEKQKYMNYNDADWEKEFKGTMDTWKIEQMLFFSAIQELVNQ
jgi:hypothetical protein